MKNLCLILFFSIFINHIVNANDDMKVIGYTEGGNQWLLISSNNYMSTDDPKIFTKEINVTLKVLLCKGCKYTHNNLVCQKNRNLFEGDEVNCKDKDAIFEDEVLSNAKIKCFGKICKLEITNTYLTGSNRIRNVLQEMGNAEFNLDERIIVNKVDENKENDAINSSNNIPEKKSNNNRSKLENAKISCLKLGLKVKTEKFAECVLMFF